MQILVVVAATQANQLCSGEIILAKNWVVSFLKPCRNDSFSFSQGKERDSDGINALRAEVEKVSGRAALGPG